MSIAARFGALGALIAVLALGPAACQTQGTTTSIATDEGDAPLTSWLAKPEGRRPLPRRRADARMQRDREEHLAPDGLARPERACRALERERIRDAHRRQLRASPYHRRLPDRRKILFAASQRRLCRVRSSGVAAVRGRGSYRIPRSVAGWRHSYFVSPHVATAESRQGTAQPSRTTPTATISTASIFRLLILIGAEDDWTPARLCRDLAPRAPDRVELVVYPDAHHSFDLPMLGPYYIKGMSGRLHTVQGNPEARRGLAAAYAKVLRDASRPGGLNPCRRRGPFKPASKTAGQAHGPERIPRLHLRLLRHPHRLGAGHPSGAPRAAGVDADDDTLLAAFARHEHTVQEADPSALYPVVLSRVCKLVAADLPRGDGRRGLRVCRLHRRLAALPRHDRRARLPQAARAADGALERGPRLIRPQRAAPGRSLPRRGHGRGCRELQAGAGALRARHGAARGRGHRARPGAPTWPRASSTTSCRAAQPASHLLDRPPRRPAGRRHTARRRRAGHHLPRPRRARRLAPRGWLSAG